MPEFEMYLIKMAPNRIVVRVKSKDKDDYTSAPNLISFNLDEGTLTRHLSVNKDFGFNLDSTGRIKIE